MAEDKIKVDDLPARYVDNQDQRFVSVGDMSLVLSEIYRQANEIGWETKVLDPISEFLVTVRKHKKKTTPTP